MSMQHSTPSVTSALRFGAAIDADIQHASDLSRFLLDQGQAALRSISGADRVALCNELIEQLIDPTSRFWSLDCPVETAAGEFGLHPRSLMAALAEALPGLRVTTEMASDAATLNSSGRAHRDAGLCVLAGNLPVLLPQVLFPALLTARPIAFKLPSRASTFNLAALNWLATNRPSVALGTAALSWPGGAGDAAIERELLEATPAFKPVLVYAGASAINRYRALDSQQRVLEFGPKTSVALVVDDTPSEAEPAWLEAVARDVVLFEQRGCLSVTSVVLVSDPCVQEKRAEQLAAALSKLTESIPLPNATDVSTASARHWIDAALLSGHRLWGDLAHGGTVVITEAIKESPSARTVLLVAASDLENGLAAIERRQMQDRDIQGVALWGLSATQQRAVCSRLDALDISRIAKVGELQRTDHRWNNGGVNLMSEFAS